MLSWTCVAQGAGLRRRSLSSQASSLRYISMEAQNLNCPNCGAAISSDSPQCKYCESKLATIACPSCFAMMFMGSKHCPHCGTTAGLPTAAELSVLQCPRCRIDMSSISLGGTAMRECEKCEGLWVGFAAFEKICADREQNTPVLGDAIPVRAPNESSVAEFPKAVYVPCPQCGELMNRVNFARCSGVIVDVCRGHGTWFDRDELRKIVQFIRAGGLGRSREKEKRELQHELDQLRSERVRYRHSELDGVSFSESERVYGVSAASDLLKLLIKD
jgi:Zn-finger nucleic acid-binding protein